jgi:hypothetical protein
LAKSPLQNKLATENTENTEEKPIPGHISYLMVLNKFFDFLCAPLKGVLKRKLCVLCGFVGPGIFELRSKEQS